MATEEQARRIFPHPDAFERNEAEPALDLPETPTKERIDAMYGYGSLGTAQRMLEYPTGTYAVHPEMNAAENMRVHRLNHCVEILKEALEIRLNAPLMDEIRAHLRLMRDEIAVLLDDMPK